MHFCTSRSEGPHRHREAQLDEHGETEHQGPDRVRPQPGTHARLRLRSSPAVLRRDGTLSETRVEKYVKHAPRCHLFIIRFYKD